VCRLAGSEVRTPWIGGWAGFVPLSRRGRAGSRARRAPGAVGPARPGGVGPARTGGGRTISGTAHNAELIAPFGGEGLVARMVVESPVGRNRRYARRYDSCMPGRHSSLVVRILLVPLIVLGPLGTLVVCALLVPSAPDAVLQVLLVLYLFYVILAIMLVPAFFWTPGPSSGPSGDGADGGDMDPPQPPIPPTAPQGGVPLPDADQARGRVRDHDRPDRREVPARRGSREPERAPIPTLPTE
jgi:hypothetical protein